MKLIFVFFAVEMLVKMTAMGVIGKKAYLAETWNRLDMFIVVAGFVTSYVVLSCSCNICGCGGGGYRGGIPTAVQA